MFQHVVLRKGSMICCSVVSHIKMYNILNTNSTNTELCQWKVYLKFSLWTGLFWPFPSLSSLFFPQTESLFTGYLKFSNLPSWSSSFNSSATASPGWMSLLSPPQTLTPRDLLLLTFSKKATLSLLPVVAVCCSWVFSSLSGFREDAPTPSRCADEPVANLGAIVRQLIGKWLGVKPVKNSSSRTCRRLGLVAGSGLKSLMINSWAVWETFDGM